jgi:6-pyruvoyltetrahydropterin/6-carboxytetrahydropterin synthase
MYQSGKAYGHDLGFSCAFRQPKAQSHCSKIHGYALSFKFIFETAELDENGWVIDFGSLKPLKAELEKIFDHKTIIAEDDPHIEYFKDGEERQVLDLVILPGVGCENFAKYVFSMAAEWLRNTQHAKRVMLVSATVAEHGANHATYINPELDVTRRAVKKGLK